MKARIGFLGGCVTRQEGIPTEALFHEILRKNFFPDAEMVTGHYLSFSELPGRVASFIEQKRPGVLFLFIRPFPLLPLFKAVVKYEGDDGKPCYAWHPAIFRSSSDWDPRFSAHQTIRPFQPVRQLRFRVADGNVLLGKCLGLHRWAQHYLLKQLDAVRLRCESAEVPLTLLSTPPYSSSFTGSHIMKSTDVAISAWCHSNHIPYHSVVDWNADNFIHKYHFSEIGHQRLAELIASVL